MAMFTNFVLYVSYLKEEKAKIQWFLNCFLASYKERTEFDNLKTMDEVLGKVKLCYQKFRTKSESGKLWKNKKGARVGGGVKRKKPY